MYLHVLLCARNTKLLQGGHWIVQILRSQGIVLLRNRSKQELVLSKFLESLFFEKKAKNRTISGDLYYLV